MEFPPAAGWNAPPSQETIRPYVNPVRRISHNDMNPRNILVNSANPTQNPYDEHKFGTSLKVSLCMQYDYAIGANGRKQPVNRFWPRRRSQPGRFGRYTGPTNA